MQRCKGFVFAGEEDFGIVMAEAQACGAPVIALARGGATEIVQEGNTGLLFKEPTTDSLTDGLERFERERFDSSEIRAAALRFGRQRFLSEFSEFVSTKMDTEPRTAAV
jgi:glycosyltransferase involved in cell wall biosynthesis